jgi:hypothetical protein
MILIPNKGRLVKKSGSNAQCIAQASEAVIPMASQFILDFMKRAKVQKSNIVAK